MRTLSTIIILSVLLASCKDILDPELKAIENISIMKPGFLETVIRVEVRYFNPNHTKAKLKEAEGDAWINNNYLGHFKLDSLISVPANAEFLVPVDMTIKTMDMIQAFKNKEEMLVKIKGTAKAGKGGFYKKFSLDYEGKQDISQLIKP